MGPFRMVQETQEGRNPVNAAFRPLLPGFYQTKMCYFAVAAVSLAAAGAGFVVFLVFLTFAALVLAGAAVVAGAVIVSVACGAAAKAEPAIRVRPRRAALSLFILFSLSLGSSLSAFTTRDVRVS